MNIFLCLFMLAGIHAPAMPYPTLDRTCLAVVEYTEARGEGVAGMAAAAGVVIQRAHDSRRRWPSTICAVSMQRGQFSGVDRWDPQHIDGRSWASAKAVADIALTGAALVPPACRGAVYFDTRGKTKGRQALCQLGNHFFYKDKK